MESLNRQPSNNSATEDGWFDEYDDDNQPPSLML